MSVHLIQDATDYSAAMTRLSELMACDSKPGFAEAGELEALALVIEDYERKIVPPAQPDPVDVVLFRMDQMKLTRKRLASRIGPTRRKKLTRSSPDCT